MCAQHPGLHATIYVSLGGKVHKSKDQRDLEAFSQVTEQFFCEGKKRLRPKAKKF